MAALMRHQRSKGRLVILHLGCHKALLLNDTCSMVNSEKLQDTSSFSSIYLHRLFPLSCRAMARILHTISMPIIKQYIAMIRDVMICYYQSPFRRIPSWYPLAAIRSFDIVVKKYGHLSTKLMLIPFLIRYVGIYLSSNFFSPSDSCPLSRHMGINTCISCTCVLPLHHY